VLTGRGGMQKHYPPIALLMGKANGPDLAHLRFLFEFRFSRFGQDLGVNLY